MSYLDKYFIETNYEFNNEHIRNDDHIILTEDDTFIKLNIDDSGENIIILEHSNEDYLVYLDDINLVNEIYDIIKKYYYKENWLFVLIQIIFDLCYMNDYSNLELFIKDHIYCEYTKASLNRINIRNYIKYHRSLDNNLPLVFFHDKDFDIAKQYLNNYIFVKEENIVLRCKHFPYTCDELSNEHSNNQTECKCLGDCPLQHRPFYLCYVEFGNEDYFDDIGTCETNNCCCLINAHTRYLVKEN